ncbi:MarR family transcriptional regulator, partial [[Clostridium] innocuum]|nr:MarR family transcriptional regulator [[Clostridium] innocuum]
TQTDICKYTCLNKQTVNSYVKKLKQNGLIEFHQGNGREMKIYLTSKGQNFINENILPIEQAENEVFDEMTIQEQREILRLIENYLSSFRHKIEKLQGEK